MDPSAGYQPSGWPEYLQRRAANYTNVAGVSFIQPSDLMNKTFDLSPEVTAVVASLRKQGVTVQLVRTGLFSCVPASCVLSTNFSSTLLVPAVRFAARRW